jgi:hypothetical protein
MILSVDALDGLLFTAEGHQPKTAALVGYAFVTAGNSLGQLVGMT